MLFRGHRYVNWMSNRYFLRLFLNANTEFVSRAGATDFELEGQLVQEKGPLMEGGPFLSEPSFIPYDVIGILQGLR